MTTRTDERGMALIVTLALLTVLTMLLLNLDAATRRTTRLIHASRALTMATIAADGGIALARTLLQEDATRDPQRDTLLEPWAQPIPPFQLGHATVSLRIEDLGGRLDINALVDPRGLPITERIDQTKRLFMQLGIEPQLVDRLVDWIDPDDIPMPLGLERLDLQSPPYRPHNAPLATIGELRGIPGFTPALIQRLRPYVVAGRTIDPNININTAPPEVLEALVPGLPHRTIASVIQARPFQHLNDLEQFPAAAPLLAALRRETTRGFGITVKSPTYRATTTGTVGHTTVTAEALLARHGSDIEILQLTYY
jgi:general secretion pathway protein K